AGRRPRRLLLHSGAGRGHGLQARQAAQPAAPGRAIRRDGVPLEKGARARRRRHRGRRREHHFRAHHQAEPGIGGLPPQIRSRVHGHPGGAAGDGQPPALRRLAMDHVANYPVIRKLGEGATSEVFLCQDPFHGREVAVKRIFPESLRDPARGRLFRKLFFTEASLAGKLNHPHIAQIYDAGIGEDSGYIVMEYVPGGTMERFCAPENLLPVEHSVEIIFKCARALAYAHKQGVTHRDIKPGNILYAATPTDVRIGDFGLALNVGAETTQITGVGSPAYMSPEQIREELVDHRTDLYSLGVVMYQLLAGQLPFRGTNKFSMIYQITQYDPPPPSALRREVPASLDRIVRRAMQKEADKRYHSGDEFAEDLIEALRAGLGEAARETFGDADKFALLRTMRFFAAFVDQELWEVVK